jgi:predicted TIM-barrel fold metal-dependent hydrolase
VWLDGSALLINTAHESPENIDKFVVQPLRWIFGYIENPDKLMYGTDWPLTDMKSYKAVFQRAIPRQYRRKVFYENVQHVFKFPKKVND